MQKLNTKLAEKDAQTIKYVTPVMPGSEHGVIEKIYAQMDHDFAVAAPYVVSSPSIEQLKCRWALNREVYLVETNVRRKWKELIALQVSKVNECPYCIEAHSMGLDIVGDGESKAVLGEVPLEDSKLEALSAWVKDAHKLMPYTTAAMPFDATQASNGQ